MYIVWLGRYGIVKERVITNGRIGWTVIGLFSGSLARISSPVQARLSGLSADKAISCTNNSMVQIHGYFQGHRDLVRGIVPI